MDNALADLRLSQASRHDLVCNLAHDLRSPLTSMQAYIGILLEGELPESAREGLQIVSGRLEQIVAHVQAFGATESQETTCDVVSESHKSAPSCTLEISAMPAAEVVPVRLDLREQAPQAFMLASQAMPTAQPMAPVPAVSDSPVPTPPNESWRMEAPTLPRSKPSNWLAERLARLDRLQRMALGAGGAVLLIVIIFITIVLVWQQSHW